ncbi:aspartate aminotransferase family protein [Micromonospora endolithica]|uniref:Aspartate aminotransferase family protein n=2 Tax=Micromonospora endolithica TaxID=230091 RepID=A0A3A9ZHW6_9ACTN|nr:aspartate aminotransferase family protein [Micromonospora endolithica]
MAEVLRLVTAALAETAAGDRGRGGPAPAGGPDAVTAGTAAAVAPVLPDVGVGAEPALRTLARSVAAGSVNPAHPYCAAHLHAPPLAVAAAADLVASVLNASLDSWDQAPSTSALEAMVTGELARLAYPAAPAPDALVTTGGTESNLVATLLARERARGGRPDAPATLRVVCGDNAHHSVPRAAWQLGLPPAVVVPSRDGVLHPSDVAAALAGLDAPVLLVATAGTTDRGALDPLPALAGLARSRGAMFHVDAAYGGGLLLSRRRRALLTGLDRADTVGLDLHKLGWQPLAAGLLAVRDTGWLAPLDLTADYLNADDDVAAGLPSLLGRSIRTSRRADVVKIAVTLRALGRTGLGDMVDRCCDLARAFAAEVRARPTVQLRESPALSTVLFRPASAGAGDRVADDLVTEVRRRLLDRGAAVLGRATLPGPHGDESWLKVTLLNPYTTTGELAALLDLVETTHADLRDDRADQEETT